MKESSERVLEWTIVITFVAVILLVLPLFYLAGFTVALIYLAVVLPCIGSALGGLLCVEKIPLHMPVMLGNFQTDILKIPDGDQCR